MDEGRVDALARALVALPREVIDGYFDELTSKEKNEWYASHTHYCMT